jgi:WD40-like Beta Propeller Repeat
MEQQRFQRIKDRYWLGFRAVLCAFLVVHVGPMLGGCSGHVTVSPLPDLHMPGVARVTAFDRFLQRGRWSLDTIHDITAYQPNGKSTTARALMVLGGSLYDTPTDGTPPVHLNIQGSCFDRPALTHDGQWLLCQNEAGVIAQAFPVTTSTSSRVAVENTHSAQLQDGNRPQRPAWAPDARHFAVGLFTPDNCAIGVYQADPPYSNARLVTQLSFPHLYRPMATVTQFEHTCKMEDVAWSPDGKWFVFIITYPLESVPNHLYAVDAQKLALTGTESPSAPQMRDVPADALVDLGAGGIRLTWPAQPETVSMATGGAIVNINLVSHERQNELVQDIARMCAASWTPDATQLFFVLCAPGNVEILGPDPQLYVYMPERT